MDDRIERVILNGLIFDEKYTRKVLPFLKEDYFENPAERIFFRHVNQFFEKYNKAPDLQALAIAISTDRKIPEDLFASVKAIVNNTKKGETLPEWLSDQTEKFCKDRAVYNAVIKSIEILDGKDSKLTKDALPQLLQDALGVGFDLNVGHDYFENAEQRYEFYHDPVQKIPFKLKLLNKVTKGGIPRKTLNVVMAGTGVGKSLFMCDYAAFLVLEGYNVLYITAEMAEMRIGERLDANLLGVTLDELMEIGKDNYTARLEKLKAKTKGKLIVKEYPTAVAHVGHFRALLSELKVKLNFKPDIIFVDYLNICASSRFKTGTDSYTYIKAIAEELRGLGVEYDVPVFTATQVNRGGFSNTDMEMDEVSESWGLPSTADFFIALIGSEELDKLNQVMVKQLKNRYGDPNYFKRFVLGIDRNKMKLYDLEEKAQLVGQTVVMQTEAGKSSSAITREFFNKSNRKPPLKGLDKLHVD